MLRAMFRLKTRQGTTGGRDESFKLLRDDYVIVFVLRNHYVAGENTRMSHHRSLIFLKLDFMTPLSPSEYYVMIK